MTCDIPASMVNWTPSSKIALTGSQTSGARKAECWTLSAAFGKSERTRGPCCRLWRPQFNPIHSTD